MTMRPYVTVKMVKVMPTSPPSLVTESEREPVIRAQKRMAAAGTRDNAKVPTAEAASVIPTMRVRKLASAGAKNAAGKTAQERPKRIPSNSIQRISATLATDFFLRSWRLQRMISNTTGTIDRPNHQCSGRLKLFGAMERKCLCNNSDSTKGKCS